MVATVATQPGSNNSNFLTFKIKSKKRLFLSDPSKLGFQAMDRLVANFYVLLFLNLTCGNAKLFICGMFCLFTVMSCHVYGCAPCSSPHVYCGSKTGSHTPFSIFPIPPLSRPVGSPAREIGHISSQNKLLHISWKFSQSSLSEIKCLLGTFNF